MLQHTAGDAFSRQTFDQLAVTHPAVLARFCDEGLLSPVVELRNILSDSERRPGDVMPNWSGGRPLACSNQSVLRLWNAFSEPGRLLQRYPEAPEGGT